MGLYPEKYIRLKMDGLISGGGLKSGILRYAKAFVLLKDAHTYLKIIQLTCFCICFVKQGGAGVTFFKGSEMGDVPRAEGGHIFLRDPKGGVKKYSVKRNANLQTPLLIKNDTSLKDFKSG